MLVAGFILVLCAGLKVTVADYACLCNYAVEASIYVTMDTASAVIGNMYEFDCSAEYTQASNLTPGWKAVATNHRIGYIQNTESIDAQTCDGDPDSIDAVTTPFSTLPTTTTTAKTTTTTQKTTTLPITTSTSTVKQTTSFPITQLFTVALTTSSRSTVAPTTTVPKTTPTSTVKPTTTPTSTIATTTANTKAPTSSTTTQASTPSTTTKLPKISTTTNSPTTSTTTRKAQTTTASPIVTHPPTIYHIPGLQGCPAKVMSAANYNHGYVRMHAGSCYELVPASYTWQYAENNCAHKGGHLVHISNQDEENFVLQFLQSHGYDHAVWTGLNDRQNEEHFSWTSGDGFVWQNWMPGRKSNFYHHNYEDCVVYVPYAHYAHWDDVDCGRTHPWICRYDGARAVTTAHTLLNFIHNIMGRDVNGKI